MASRERSALMCGITRIAPVGFVSPSRLPTSRWSAGATVPVVQAAFGTHDIHEVTTDLLEGLGAAVLQAMTGAKNPGLPAQWTRADGPAPDSDTQQRLRLAHQVWQTLTEAEGPSVALAWLVGSNPLLADATPITYIRNLRVDEVLGAAQAFINDVPA